MWTVQLVLFLYLFTLMIHCIAEDNVYFSSTVTYLYLWIMFFVEVSQL